MRITFILGGLASLLNLSLAAPTPEHIITDAALELGKVRLCNGIRGGGTCVDVNAHLTCVQLASPVRFNVQSLVQSKGNYCVYSQGNWCDNNAFGVNSGQSEQVADVSPKWSPVLTGIICIPYSSAKAAVDDNLESQAAGVSTAIPVAQELANREADNKSSLGYSSPILSSPVGDALLCKTDFNTGPCFKIVANGQCIDIVGGVDRHARMIFQNKGSVCEYFETDGCSGKLGSTDSTRGNIQVLVPSQIGDRLGSALCRPT
ncbi:hypothetical protein N0V94_004405 [Neodidymelliopsis sp. IMI 364377]|nr:hypothetical protein N0V94_004405 [Neodidymelliopsis sp. IMI 364377]